MLSLAEAIERTEPEPRGAEGEVEQLREWDERLGG
jgi:hypothetical protein